MIAVVFGKIIATSLSVGSGGSGGVFVPGLVTGTDIGGNANPIEALANVAGIAIAEKECYKII
jgi:H+/Cl- antiporter ClcA